MPSLSKLDKFMATVPKGIGSILAISDRFFLFNAYGKPVVLQSNDYPIFKHFTIAGQRPVLVLLSGRILNDSKKHILDQAMHPKHRLIMTFEEYYLDYWRPNQD